MSWGKGVALALGAFICMISYFVYQSTQQDFDLVTENYYEEALDYDEVQIKRSNYKKLNDNTKIVLSDDNLLSVSLPEIFDSISIEGKVSLYRPTNSDADVSYQFNSSRFDIPTKGLLAGLWHIKIEWESNKKSYLFESSTFINN